MSLPVIAGRWRWGDGGFEASLSYVVKHCLKAKPSKEVFGRPEAAANLGTGDLGVSDMEGIDWSWALAMGRDIQGRESRVNKGMGKPQSRC